MNEQQPYGFDLFDVLMGTIFFLIPAMAYLGVLFGLVRFVKWAWQ